MADLDWLNDFIDALPEKSKVRRNLISIAGYPSWENVNSNFLAFYFDKTEDHNFGTLFIDSLLEFVKSEYDINLAVSDYSITREFVSNKGNRIDLVIQDENSEWAIVIENKINHFLNNDLVDYWNSVEANHKIGIVLSKNESDFPDSEKVSLKEKNITYHHVTHDKLVNKVSEKIGTQFILSDDRHLLFLKEFISNTLGMYENPQNMKNQLQTIKAFHKHIKEIIEFKDADLNLLKELGDVVSEIFAENGFESGSNKTAKGKHFYPTNNHLLNDDVFRVFVDINALRYVPNFTAYVELYKNENTKHGTQIKNILDKKGVFDSLYLKKGTGGSDNAYYQHVYEVSIPLDLNRNDLSYKEILNNHLAERFFNSELQYLELLNSAWSIVENEG